MSASTLSELSAHRRRAVLRWLMVSVLSAAGLGLGYLAVFDIWLPARLVAFAKQYGFSLDLTGFRSLYPGDLRAEAVHLSGQSDSFQITTKAVHGRVKLWALLGGSLELAWLRVEGAQGSVKTPGNLLLACSHWGPEQRLAQEAGLGELPSVRQILVDRAAIDVASSKLGTLELDGHVEVRLTRAILAEGRLEMEAFAHSGNVRVTRETAPGSAPATVDGEIAWQLLPRKGGASHSDGTRLVVRSSTHWKAANLGALLGSGPDLEARDAHLGVELRMTDGTARRGSYVALQAAELRAPPFRAAPNGALFRRVRMRLELAARPFAAADLAGSVSLRSADVEFGFHGEPQHFSLAGEATIDQLNTSSPGVLLSAGQFHLRRGETRSRSTAQQSLDLDLTFDRASWSSGNGLGLSGALLARGSDASALLDLGPPNPGARWMLSELVLAPFSLRLAVRLKPERIAFEDITLTTAADDASGALFLDDAGVRGALLVKRGKLNIGVEVEPDAMTLKLGAKEDWLTRSVAALSAAQSP